MTNRERFLATWRFENTGHFCHIEHGFWEETYKRYRNEGLSAEVTMPHPYLVSRGDLYDYFGVMRMGYIQPNNYMCPPLETKIIEDADTYAIWQNGHGARLKTSKNSLTLPQEIGYEINNREDYFRLRERFTSIDLHARYGGDRIEKTIEGLVAQDDYAAVGLHMDGFFSFLRELTGVVNTAYLFYDDPELIRIMYHDRVEMIKAVYEPIIKLAKPDYAFIWEDMCFKNGPLLSPSLFEEFALPAYFELIDFFHSCGVSNVVVDSDGNITRLIPLWLKAGVNGLLPFEVQSGMDVVAIGEQYKELVIFGGIDKRVLEGTKEDIDAELNRVLPAMSKRGGYIPTLDHWVPPQISLENFSYYCEKVNSFKF